VPRKLENPYTRVYIRLLSGLEALYLAQAAVLLLARLGRHFEEERGIDTAVELVDVHEALVLSLEAPDRLFVLATLVGLQMSHAEDGSAR
jgi:hypothetical protein